MDINLVVLAGSVSASPEHRVFESGAKLLRLLITVRADEPRRRVDVVPVTLWDPPEELAEVERGRRVLVAGSVQRRFWSEDKGRKSRLEVVAQQVTLRPLEDPTVEED